VSFPPSKTFPNEALASFQIHNAQVQACVWDGHTHQSCERAGLWLGTEAFKDLAPSKKNVPDIKLPCTITVLLMNMKLQDQLIEVVE
jgi:hypothetical protein